jgi:hypothetical protein
MPGSEEMLMANDWELLRLWAGQDASKEQLEAYIKRLSEPGESFRKACCCCRQWCCSIKLLVGKCAAGFTAEGVSVGRVPSI